MADGTDTTDPTDPTGAGPLIGHWRRVGEVPTPSGDESVPFGQDPAQLPGEITFAESRFSAQAAPGQGFIVWDVGNYRVDDEGLHLTLANDAWATYGLDLGAGTFTVTDGSGHETVYQHVD
jgi:hypothetical protein